MICQNCFGLDRRRGRHLQGRNYFVTTSGNITDELITEYIKIKIIMRLLMNLL